MEEPSVRNLHVDVIAVLPAVGDRKLIKGTANLVLEDVYGIRFEPGDQASWSLELRRIAGGVEVSGTVTGTASLLCYRCLENYEYPLDLKVREHALWLSDSDLEESGSEPSEYMVLDGVLDLETVLRDSISLAFPATRVCDNSCKGLCARCGANLNLETCDCPKGAVDERLKPLEQLKKRLEEGSS
jgi:uncharacterized protein